MQFSFLSSTPYRNHPQILVPCKEILCSALSTIFFPHNVLPNGDEICGLVFFFSLKNQSNLIRRTKIRGNFSDARNVSVTGVGQVPQNKSFWRPPLTSEALSLCLSVIQLIISREPPPSVQICRSRPERQMWTSGLNNRK